MAVATTSDIQFYSNTFNGSAVNSSDRLIGCVDELVTAKFTVTFDTAIQGVRLLWGLIKNSTTLPSSPTMNYSTLLFRHIDFKLAQSYQKNNMAVTTPTALDKNNNKITRREGEYCIATISADRLSVDIEHAFYIQGRAKSDYITDGEIDASLNSYYTGSESLKYIYRLEYFDVADDYNVKGDTDMINIAKTDYFKDGEAGYYNEWKNGISPNYQKINYEYSEADNTVTFDIIKYGSAVGSDKVVFIGSRDRAIAEFGKSKEYNDALAYFQLSNNVGGGTVQNMFVKSYDVTNIGGGVFRCVVEFREGFYFGDYVFTALCGVDVSTSENDKLNTNVFSGVTPIIQRTDNLENIANAPIKFKYHNGSSLHTNIVGYVEDYILASTTLELARGVNFNDTVNIQSITWRLQRNNGDSFDPNYVTVDSVLFSGVSLNTPLTTFTQNRFDKLNDDREFASVSLGTEDAINNLGGFYIEDSNTIKRFDGGDFTSYLV